MKSNKIKWMLAGCVFLIVSSCGKDKDPIDSLAGVVNAPELQRTFLERGCRDPLALKVIGGSTRTRYTFSGDSVRKTEEFYEGGDCQVLAASVTYEGTFDKKDKVREDVHQINLVFNKVTGVPHSQKGIDTLNTIQLCGKSSWQKDVVLELTHEGRGATCPLATLPMGTYDIYSVQGDTLYFGKENADKKDEPSERPAELNMDMGFVRQ